MRVARSRSFAPTGIASLRSSLPGATAVFCCAGTSLRRYDDTIPPRSWPRFAVNSAIRRLSDVADFWVLADEPIALEYEVHALAGTAILAMHEAGPIMARRARGRPVYTVDSTPEAVTYGDGRRFFSRGTVLIGALEMARYMGVRRAFIFGLDCYARERDYYYDGRVPPKGHEARPARSDRVRGLPFVAYVTPCLRRMIEKLDVARAAGLWDGMEIWCVGSSWSQQRAIPLMTAEEFESLVSKERTTV